MSRPSLHLAEPVQGRAAQPGGDRRRDRGQHDQGQDVGPEGVGGRGLIRQGRPARARGLLAGISVPDPDVLMDWLRDGFAEIIRLYPDKSQQANT